MKQKPEFNCWCYWCYCYCCICFSDDTLCAFDFNTFFLCVAAFFVFIWKFLHVHFKIHFIFIYTGLPINIHIMIFGLMLCQEVKVKLFLGVLIILFQLQYLSFDCFVFPFMLNRFLFDLYREYSFFWCTVFVCAFFLFYIQSSSKNDLIICNLYGVWCGSIN